MTPVIPATAGTQAVGERDHELGPRLCGDDVNEATDSLLAAVNAAGASFRRVIFTRNRRVLVSVGERGAAIRLHACFRGAPAEVASALGRMYARRSAADSAVARTVVRAFLSSREAELAETAAVPRRRRVPAADREHVARLSAEFERVNREEFGGRLPKVPIFLSGRMRRRNGHFSAQPLEIVISRRLCTAAAAGEAEHTLRHEMIHLCQHFSGGKVDHGCEFRRWAEQLRVHPRAKRAVKSSLF